MRPSEYIIIAVAFCMVVSVFGIAYVSTAADYGLTAQLNASDFSKQYNVTKKEARATPGTQSLSEEHGAPYGSCPNSSATRSESSRPP
jgi:uncharacterized membrane protein YagU involved in acid resistance